MPVHTLIDKLFSFLGVPHDPHRNDFRNPIWGDDDDDDGDELYADHARINVFTDPNHFHSEITKQMIDTLKSFSGLFGENMKSFHDDLFNHDSNSHDFIDDHTPNENHNANIRDYYLKPGYQHENSKQDMDLDGKISSRAISGLLKRKSDNETTIRPFDSNLIPGRPFCQTVIVTSVTKPDGTVETRKIVKNANGITEETTTTTSTKSGPDEKSPLSPGLDTLSPSACYIKMLNEFTSRWSNFN